MTTNARTLAAAALVAALYAITVQPAHAEKVVGHDPKGDAPFYDIATVTVNHKDKPKRVRFTIRAYDRSPYGYNVLIDTPGGKPWEYVVSWAGYWPHKTWVDTRKQWYSAAEDSRCELFSGRELNLRDVTFSAPIRCFRKSVTLRARAKGWDDEAGYMDQTAWTRWRRG